MMVPSGWRQLDHVVASECPIPTPAGCLASASHKSRLAGHFRGATPGASRLLSAYETTPSGPAGPTVEPSRDLRDGHQGGHLSHGTAAYLRHRAFRHRCKPKLGPGDVPGDALTAGAATNLHCRMASGEQSLRWNTGRFCANAVQTRAASSCSMASRSPITSASRCWRDDPGNCAAQREKPCAVRHPSPNTWKATAARLPAACKLGLEDIVSKRINSPYRSGKIKTWLKVKR